MRYEYLSYFLYNLYYVGLVWVLPIYTVCFEINYFGHLSWLDCKLMRPQIILEAQL